VRYPVSELASRYGASVTEETSDWRQAYATIDMFRRERPTCWDRLPWAQPSSTIAGMDEFVPPHFEVPRGLVTPQFVLEPLGPEHNDQDYDAWTSSMDHIRATPGFQESRWPREMTPDENRGDLQRHADDFRNRTGFTYTVLDPSSRDVIGCVYIYPQPDSDDDAIALSWVRASRAELDAPLWRAVNEWLASDWPFGSVKYATRS
jgi:hypothetical protein